MTEPQRTRPSDKTRTTEEEDALVRAHADEMPTSDEEAAAERAEPDANVAAEYKEALDRGANQQGEGRIP